MPKSLVKAMAAFVVVGLIFFIVSKSTKSEFVELVWAVCLSLAFVIGVLLLLIGVEKD